MFYGKICIIIPKLSLWLILIWSTNTAHRMYKIHKQINQSTITNKDNIKFQGIHYITYL